MTITISAQLMTGMYICPAALALVCVILRRGMKPSWIACWVTEKAPEMTAWLAITVAMVANITSGRRNASLARYKKGVWITSIFSSGGSAMIIATWPT